jgi:hypothetical protein
MNRMILVSVLMTSWLAGCADNQLIGYDSLTNFLSFNHPFTDQATADVQARAEKLCAQRKQVALKTARTCSLTQCTSNFQCLDQADAAPYGL